MATCIWGNFDPVMASCLTTPSLYLKQCWLTISEVQCQSPEGNFTTDTSAINYYNHINHVFCVTADCRIIFEWCKQGTPSLNTYFHDDVIKWKHFSRYWPIVREFTGLRWFSRTKVSDSELWCFLWSVSKYTAEKTIVRLVIWDAIAPIMTPL